MSDLLKNPIVITGAARTPIGGLQDALAGLSAPELGAAAIAGTGVSPEAVSSVLMGCVLQAGQGQAPARQAALGAGLPPSVPCATINKMCGSGMAALMLAADGLCARPDEVIVAGGMESMSNAPYLLPKARAGLRYGHGEVLDHMALDGLEDAYARRTPMGAFAEDTAAHYGFTRAAQDEYAIASLMRARAATESGAFAGEIVPVGAVERDEGPFRVNPEKIPHLRAAFREGGTVTAASSASISDGAAALVVMRAAQAERMGATPLAVVRASAVHAHEPAWFTTAPVGAISKVLERAGWRADEVDLFEINEAFAVVVLAAMKELGLSHERVNVHGGACALGHPIGASGARIIVTLIHALLQRGLRRGVAALCIGGGEAAAVALELPPP